MKKNVIKKIVMLLAVCTVSAFTLGLTGCDVKETLKEKIEQLRCEHEMNDGEIAVQATCEDVGEKTLTCALCGYEETAIIPAVGHQWFNVNSVEPTCTIDGHGQGVQCVLCEEWLVCPFSVPALGHTNETILGYEPTCTEMGLTDGEKCAVCDTVFVEQKDVPMLEHVLKGMEAYSATCEEKGFTGGTKCENCDYATEGEIIPAFGHSYDDGVVTTEATCETDGKKTLTCATCAGTKVEIIPANGHKFENGMCTVCGIDEQQLISFTVIVTDASGGVMGSYTSTAIKGSSWAEWVASTDFEIAYGGAPIVTDNNFVTCPGGDRYYLKEAAGYDSRSITADEIIQENTVYYFVTKCK